jgi:hypothetical protein
VQGKALRRRQEARQPQAALMEPQALQAVAAHAVVQEASTALQAQPQQVP